MATRGLLVELALAYEKTAGRRIAVESVGGVDAVRRVEAGEPFDFVVLAADAIDKLAAAGHVDPASRTAVVRSGVAVAVRAGAPHPDIASEEAVRTAVLGAGRIGYSTGPSGVYLTRLFQRWGIAEAIAARIVQAPPGVPVGTLLARGEVDLGFQQLSELMHQPGIDVLGPLPPAIQVTTIFSAARCRPSTRRDETAAWLSYLASAAAAEAKYRHGMEPAEGSA